MVKGVGAATQLYKEQSEELERIKCGIQTDNYRLLFATARCYIPTMAVTNIYNTGFKRHDATRCFIPLIIVVNHIYHAPNAPLPPFFNLNASMVLVNKIE